MEKGEGEGEEGEREGCTEELATGCLRRGWWGGFLFHGERTFWRLGGCGGC